MKNTLELIQILDAIDQNGSFEAAANKLHKVRSALTYTIQKFEENLGIKLYDRTHHRAKLTEAGWTLLNQGRDLINLNKQLIENIKQISSGWELMLSVAYDEIICLNPLFDLIKSFQIECSHTRFELHSEILGGCIDALISHRVDIALGFPGPLPSTNEFIFEPIGKVKFVFAVAPFHPLAKIKEPLSTELIKTYHAIVARDSARQMPLQTSMLLSDQNRLTFSNLALKRKAQILGLGVGFLPYHLIEKDIVEKKLVVKKVERAQPPSYVYMGWNKTKMGKAHQWFLKKIKNKIFLRNLLK